MSESSNSTEVAYLGLHSLYADDISSFLAASVEQVLGTLAAHTGFEIVVEARNAWTTHVAVLQDALSEFAGRGRVYLEFPIPRLGKWIDAVVVLDQVVFVIEFKVGETAFRGADRDQVWDYALDLRNFHDTSHTVPIAPVLVATRAFAPTLAVAFHTLDDRMALPMAVGAEQLRATIEQMLTHLSGPRIDATAWERGRYQPTPTIIEAARALYANHSVAAISRSDAGAKNLQRTAQIVDAVISEAQRDRRKCICFVTGAPGAGKTLVGLDVATRHRDAESALHSVFLSGNGPLVSVLREALARDHVARNSTPEHRVRKGDARRIVNAFIQPVHHFRDAYLADPNAPADHVVLFDEAQRAWDMKQTSDFMRRKKNQPDFSQSEPEFLIACMDRHADWAVVVCLVGGGQEINTGEAGVSEWFDALGRRFPAWQVHLSPQLLGSEYRAEAAIAKLRVTNTVVDHEDLHLSTSMRSYRAERLSEFVRLVIDREVAQARATLASFATRYPILVTRDLGRAKAWLRAQARGGERYGMVVSSQAQRLKPLAIDVRPKVDPVHWFLHEKDDVRSSYALEDVGTEFQVQGLELDWTCVVWDADLRHTAEGWRHHEFVGTRWNRIHQERAQRYLENAYRVLLTRARQGMVIVVPEGNADDPTRDPSLYDQTFGYLQSVGIRSLD